MPTSEFSEQSLINVSRTVAPISAFRTVKKLRGGVAEARAGASGALPDVQLVQQCAVLMTRPLESALRSAIGMEDRVSCRVSARMGHPGGVCDQAGAHVVGHRPATTSRVHRSITVAIQPALGRRQTGDISDEFQTGQGCAVKFRRIRSGASGVVRSCLVSDRDFRRVIPTIARSRMIRATRLRFTRCPWYRSSE